MKVLIRNRQKHSRLNPAKLASLARFLLLQAQRRSAREKWREITVVLSDNAQMELLNRKFLNRCGATDVITFTLPPLPGGHASASGEIYLNVPLAFVAGARRGGVTAELALYLAHGCDHLSGANDRTKRERCRMRRRELRWLRQARRLGLVKGLLK